MMYTITEREYDAKPQDYRSVSQDGERMLLVWDKVKGTRLIVEGSSLMIVNRIGG